MRRLTSVVLCALLVALVGIRAAAQGARSVNQEQPAVRRLIPFTESQPATSDWALKQAPSTVPLAAYPPFTPNDPGWDNKLGLIKLPGALGELNQLMLGGQNAQWRQVIVVVIDGGIIPGHPDLEPNRYDQGRADVDEIGGTVTDNHGTSVMSILDALTNNSLGAASIAGFTRTVSVIHVRIFDNNGSSSGEIAGINAVSAMKDRGLPVVAVNCSFGGSGAVSSERDALKALTDRGVVVFAGALPSSPGEGCNFYPACYYQSNPRIVPVTVLNDSGDGLSQPNFWGAIAAPSNVRVAIDPSRPNLIAGFGGVSSATPQPAAAFALLMSTHPSLGVDDALHLLELSCDRSAPGVTTTFGKLDVATAITTRPLFVGQEGAASGAAALDSVTLMRGPFSVKIKYLTSGYRQDEQTRVALFAYNVDPAQPLSAVTITATDAQGLSLGTLPVEAMTALPGLPFVTRITIRLTDTLAGKGVVQLTLTSRNQQSDPLSITVQ